MGYLAGADICRTLDSTRGEIGDDWLKKNFLDRIPSNVTLLILLDCCHASGIIRLPYVYNEISKTFDGKTRTGITKEHLVSTHPDVGKILFIGACKANETALNLKYDSASVNDSGAFTDYFLCDLKDLADSNKTEKDESVAGILERINVRNTEKHDNRVKDYKIKVEEYNAASKKWEEKQHNKGSPPAPTANWSI